MAGDTESCRRHRELLATRKLPVTQSNREMAGDAEAAGETEVAGDTEAADDTELIRYCRQNRSCVRSIFFSELIRY